MSFLSLEHFLQFGLGIWLALLFLLLAVRMLGGGLGLRGLLTTASPAGGRAINPERVVVLVTALSIIGAYALKALDTDVTANVEHPQLPDIPASLLTVLTGSNTLYLAGKIMRLR